MKTGEMNELPPIRDVAKGLELPKAIQDANFSIDECIRDFIDGFIEGFMKPFEWLGEFLGITDSDKEKAKDGILKPGELPTGQDASDAQRMADTREFGVKECADAAKDIFTPQVMQEWGMMSAEARFEKLEEYARRVADVLGVQVRVIYQEGLIQQGCWGYNDGMGNVVLDASFVTDPAQVLEAVSTIAHEIRHQFQRDVCNNPSAYDIDPLTVAEWTVGFQTYTQERQTAEDPWGYFFNPVEIDARYFGESVVRELTRGFIDN